MVMHGTHGFLSLDPVRGDAHSPQTFNLFAYVENNPVNFIDPFGLQGGTLIWPPKPKEPPGGGGGESFDNAIWRFLWDLQRRQYIGIPWQRGNSSGRHGSSVGSPSLVPTVRPGDIGASTRDYEALEVCVSLVVPVGPCGSLSRDRIGRWYLTIGAGFGKALFPVTVSLKSGSFTERLSADLLRGSLTKWGGSASFGALGGIGGYFTLNPFMGARAAEWSIVVGAQAGIGAGYTWPLQ